MRKQNMYKHQIVFNKLLRHRYFLHLILSFPIVVGKLLALSGIILYNGFNIPIFNRWSVLFKGNVYRMFSKQTLSFIIVLLGIYIIAVFFRSLVDYRILIDSIEIYRNKDLWNRKKEEQNAIDEHYLQQMKGMLKYGTAFSFRTQAVQLFRDIDYMSLMWSLPFFPVIYNFEVLVPAVKMLYPKDNNQKISYRASVGEKKYIHQMYWYTILIWIVNNVIPGIALYFLLKNPNLDPYSSCILIGIVVINTLTYPISKYKHFSIWIVNNPFKVDKRDIKKSRRAQAFNWTKLFTGFRDGFKYDENLDNYDDKINDN